MVIAALFVLGIAGFIWQAFFADFQQPSLIALFSAMTGTPALWGFRSAKPVGDTRYAPYPAALRGLDMGLSYKDLKWCWKTAWAELDEIERSAGLIPSQDTSRPWSPSPYEPMKR